MSPLDWLLFLTLAALATIIVLALVAGLVKVWRELPPPRSKRGDR